MVTETAAALNNKSPSSPHSTISNTSQVASEIKKLVINRDENGSFGINIIGGTDQPYIPGHNGVFICRVRRTDLDGINEGDQILAVNGIELIGKTHAEVVKLLKEMNDDCVFTIETNAEKRIAASHDDVATGNLQQNQLNGSVLAAAFSGSPPSSTTEGTRTRESSTSTVTYAAIQNESAHKMISGGDRIDESDILNADDETSVVLSSDDSTSDAGTLRHRSQTPLGREDDSGRAEQSNFMELLTLFGIGVGIVTLIAFVYVGCRRFKLGTWL